MGRSFDGGGLDRPSGHHAPFESARPKIEGFTEAETEAIYDGRREDALERFIGMAPKERTEQIIPLINGLGAATYDLAEKIQAAARDEAGLQDVRAHAKANERLNAFLDDLLNVYEHGQLPSRDAN